MIDYKKIYSKSLAEKAENSIILNNNINTNKVDDESKSYIKEFLELYTSSDINNKLDEISELRNLDINSHSQHDQLNSQELILNSERKNNANPNHSYNQIKSMNIISYKDRENGKFINTQRCHRNIDDFAQINEINKDEPIELPIKRKQPTNHTSSSSAYLNRRHVETLQKLERIKKEKEIREKSEAKFKPEINKKSREIAERIISSKPINKDFSKQLSKSIECVKRYYPEENNKVYFFYKLKKLEKPENTFYTKKKLGSLDVLNEIGKLKIFNMYR